MLCIFFPLRKGAGSLLRAEKHRFRMGFDFLWPGDASEKKVFFRQNVTFWEKTSFGSVSMGFHLEAKKSIFFKKMLCIFFPLRKGAGSLFRAEKHRFRMGFDFLWPGDASEKKVFFRQNVTFWEKTSFGSVSMGFHLEAKKSIFF